MDKFVVRDANDKEDEKNTSDEWFSSKRQPKSQTTQKRERKQPIKRKTASQVKEKITSSFKNTDDDCKRVIKVLWTPMFKKEYEKLSLQSFNKEKDAAKLKAKSAVLRDAEARFKFMHGYDCRCCAPYYDALGLSPAERQRRVNEVSRHRAFEPIPPTPERYWDVQFPGEASQRDMIRLGVSASALQKQRAAAATAKREELKHLTHL